MYIVYTGDGSGPPAVLRLQWFPDDYGTLPFWLQTKSDFGYGYFATYLIDHNCLAPVRFKSLTLVKQSIPDLSSDITETHLFLKPLDVDTVFRRETDGARLTIYSTVYISDTSQGGPQSDCKIHAYPNRQEIRPFTIPKTLGARIKRRVKALLLQLKAKESVYYLDVGTSNIASIDLCSINDGFDVILPL